MTKTYVRVYPPLKFVFRTLEFVFENRSLFSKRSLKIGVVFENRSLFLNRFWKTNSNLRKQTPIFKRTNSDFCQKYSETPPYDHLVYATTSLLRPYSFKPNVKTIESFYYFEDPDNATTSLLRPGFYGPAVVALTGFHTVPS